MSTRCMVVLDNGERGYNGIYVHSDGYISWVGLFLYCFYDNERKVRDLLGLGDLSRLSIRIGHTIDFNRQQMDSEYYESVKSQCCAYARDRGEKFECYSSKKLDDFCTESYLYVFRKGEWYYKGGDAQRLSKVRIALQKDKDITDKFQAYVLNMCTNDEKEIFIRKLRELGICKVKASKLYDYTVLGHDKQGVYKVKCNLNNSIVFIPSSDIRALQREGCTVDTTLNATIIE